MGNNEFGALIYRLRKKRGMTLEDVGKIVGVSKSTVRKWETGDIANLRRDKIASLAKALGTTPQILMGWENKEDLSDYVDEIYKNPKLRELIDIAKTASDDDLDMAIQILDRMKK